MNNIMVESFYFRYSRVYCQYPNVVMLMVINQLVVTEQLCPSNIKLTFKISNLWPNISTTVYDLESDTLTDVYDIYSNMRKNHFISTELCNNLMLKTFLRKMQNQNLKSS